MLQVEDPKKVLLLQGNKVSQVIRDVLTDLHKLKKGDSVKYSRKNDLHPFETGQELTLQFFCERSDCPLFCLANHSKKRPNNLVIGRMFDFNVLDMIEVGVLDFTPIATFPGASALKPDAKVCCHAVGFSCGDCTHRLSVTISAVHVARIYLFGGTI